MGLVLSACMGRRARRTGGEEGEFKRVREREEEIGGGVHCSWNVSVREYLHSTYQLCPRSRGMGLAGPQQIRPSVLRYRIIQ
jgi:hypothetical protein